MLFKLMKKLKKIVVYEFSNSFGIEWYNENGRY